MRKQSKEPKIFRRDFEQPLPSALAYAIGVGSSERGRQGTTSDVQKWGLWVLDPDGRCMSDDGAPFPGLWNGDQPPHFISSGAGTTSRRATDRATSS